MTVIRSLFNLKNGVNAEGVHPLVWAWAGVVAAYFVELTGEPQTLTSVRRPHRPGNNSKHAPPPGELVTAWDGRRHELDCLDEGDPTKRTAERFSKEIQLRYGSAVGVMLEPEWLTIRQLEKRFSLRIRNESQERAARRRVGPHIHFQLKGRLWTVG